MIIKVLLFIWQLPQILLAFILCLFPKTYLWEVDGVKIYSVSYIEGISLGNKIFMNLNSYEGTWLLKHEFGHIIQSRILGWLYIPVILIPSFIWYCLINWIQKLFDLTDNTIIRWYYKFPIEKWANNLMSISYFEVLS